MGKIILCAVLASTFLPTARAAEPEATVTLSGAWALYPMAVRWAEEYQKAHPEVKIDIAAGGAGKGMADSLAGIVDLGMVSRDVQPEEARKGAWWVSVVKDAVVPTFNEQNPMAARLLSRGMKKEDLQGLWLAGEVQGWHVYTRSDACGAAETWAKYLGKRQEDLSGTGVYGDPGVAEAVAKDTLGVGYNNINFVYDSKTRKPLPGLRVLPIDIDGNGKIGKGEDFYATLDKVTAAIADGRYPSPPARDLHFVSKGRPEKKAVAEFLEWVLTDGQAFVSEAGYINLPRQKLQQELQKLRKPKLAMGKKQAWENTGD